MNLERLIRKLRGTSQPLYRSGWGGGGEEAFVAINSTEELISYTKAKKDKRIKKKPVEVFNEILSEEPKIDLDDLDEKISLVKRRAGILKEYLGSSRIEDELAAIAFLVARKKYKKYADLFKWAVTTQPKINDLCGKYRLRLVDFQGYYKNVPMEGVEELEKFRLAWQKVRRDAPVLKLIIDEGGKEQKKDPILLAGSPFGRWFYVLGAWDKEVLVVDDLIYHGK